MTAYLTNAALKWYGGKFKLAPHIVSVFPKHRCYVEPYFGSGAVFFHKWPSPLEIINDIDDAVMNLFRVVRDEPEELKRLLSLTPYSRSEFDLCLSTHRGPLTDVERARRFFVVARQCFNGYKGDKRSAWAVCYTQNVAANFRTFEQQIALMSERLAKVQIENRPALDVCRRFDDPGNLLYLDPPYEPTTRHAALYHCDISGDDHAELLEFCSTAKARIVLSGYRSATYEEALKDWVLVEHSVVCHSAAGRKGQRRPGRSECLWLNFHPEELDFLSGE